MSLGREGPAPPRLPPFRLWLDARCAVAPERTFLDFRRQQFSYAELARLTDAVAGALHQRGVGPGDRVALLLGNRPEHLFVWLAAAKLGAAVAPLHAQWTEREVAHALTQLEPRLVVDAELASQLLGSALPFPDVPDTPAEAPAELLFTSGTTGLPKVAVQTFRALQLTGEAFASWLRIEPTDRLFTCLPLAHINARFYSTMGALAAGATLVVEERFSASKFWRWMADSGATVVNTIGAMLRILLQAPPSALDRAHQLRLVYSSPALGDHLHRQFENRFGVRLVVGYGMTEGTFGFIHPIDLPLESRDRHLEAMGKPRRHPDPRWPAGWRLVDPASAASSEPREVAAGETGEIWLSGPALFSGYLGDQETTRSVLRSDGWLRTGDLAVRSSDDFWTFVGRSKEMIRRRGENISPLEIEQALESHAAVSEAAVIGVAGELGEEEIAAFIVPAGGSDPAAALVEALTAHLAVRLARFKLPSQWTVVAALPRTSTNRIAKGELLHMLASRGPDSRSGRS